MNPVEIRAGDLQTLLLAGPNFESWSEVRREVTQSITDWNNERVS